MQSSSPLVKYCRICRDKASGFNYSGLCCESCKLFFFRNAANNKLTCLNMGKCDIDIFTRTNCAKCRLDKCLANGMRRKFCKILNKTESESILDQHMRRILLNVNSDSPNPLNLNLPQLPYVATRKKIYATGLIAPERQVIASLQNVLSETFVDESSLKMIGSIAKFIDIFELVAIYTQKVDKFCTSIPAFKQLYQTDQMIILKSFYYEILITRFIYMYDLVNEGFPIIENESANQAVLAKFDLSLQFKDQDLIKPAMEFQFQLYEELENDFTIRDLFISILLFKPRSNLSNPEFVHYQYSLYCRLLRRYLEHKYSNLQKANRKYHSLICITDGFDVQTDMARIVIRKEFDVQKLPQIVSEILDL